MRVKLLLFSFYLNGGLIAHSFCRKTVRTDVKLWTVCFLKTESEPYFGFPHISISAIYKEAWLMIVAIYRTVLISHSILSAVCCPVLLAGLWELWNILSVMINCPASETEVKWWDRELKMALLLSVALGFLFLHQARTTGQGIVSSGRPSGQNDWSRHRVLGSSIRPERLVKALCPRVVRSSVTKLDVIFWKQMHQFWCILE